MYHEVHIGYDTLIGIQLIELYDEGRFFVINIQ